MTEATRVRIEQLTGDIEYIEQLGEQGGTATVYRVETKTGKYLLKTATKARYQEWLAEEAVVLEEWMQREPGFLPEYVGFLKTEQQSHLLMQWRDGITLTTALRQATSERRIQLWQTFGMYLFQFHQRTTGGNVTGMVNGTTCDSGTLCHICLDVRHDGFTETTKVLLSGADNCQLDSWRLYDRQSVGRDGRKALVHRCRSDETGRSAV